MAAGTGARQGRGRWAERLRPRGLRWELTVLVLVAGLPALGLGLLVASRDRAADLAEARHEAHHTARTAALAYERLIQEAQGVLVGLSELPAIRDGDGPACSAFLAKVVAHTDLANLAAIRPDGTVFCSALPLPGNVDVSDLSYFQRAMATRELSLGSVHRGKISRRAVVGVALPLLDANREVTAVLYAGLLVDQLGKAFAGLPPETRVTVAEVGGKVLAAFPEDQRRWEGTETAALEIHEIVHARGDGTAVGLGLEGTPRIFGFTRLRTGGPDAVRLSVVVSVPEEVVLGAANRRFTTTVVGVLLVVALALQLARWLANVRIGRRVEALLAATARLSSGELGARTGVDHDPDEIGRLAGALDGMAASLERGAATRARLEAELRQAHKLEAVGRLAGGVAHDFNNLLTAILSYGRFLKEDLAPDDPKQEDVAEILRAGERAAGLTRQLLAFARKQTAATEVLELNPLVADAERMLRRLLGGNVSLELRPGADVPPVLADAGQLEQVVVNLVVNARDALPRGGTVIVETGRVLREPKGGGAPRPHAVLEVVDDGVGMDEETRSHLFEPFFTTKEPGKGTGLGLATVFGIVDRAGGAVEVETAPGRGTTMRVLLPAAEEAVAPAPGVVAAAPRRAAGETVLVVDDDDAVRAPIRRILAARGFRTLEARNAAEALAVAREERGPIALLVTDLRMPGASGVELALGLREERPGLEVLLVSGHADRAEVPAELAFLEKPFAPEVLAARAHALLDARRA